MNEKDLDEIKRIAQEKLEEERKQRLQAIKDYWNSTPLKKFENPGDVPNLPVTTKEEWDNFYVPKLIEAGAIPLDELKDGCYYLGDHRNATIAQWNSSDQLFYYWRQKFNQCFTDSCEHFQTFSRYAVFTPIREVSKEEFDSTNKSKKDGDNS